MINQIITDKGLSSPRFIRSSLNTISFKSELVEDSKIPFGLLIQPFADLCEGEIDSIPLADFGHYGPVRCERCNTYVNPYFCFMNNGKMFFCNMCNKENQVPTEYYCQTNMNNVRSDKFQRPELQFGTYDILAPPKYEENLKVKEIYIVIAIECSKYMIESEISEQILSSVQSVLDQIPEPQNTFISFITYS